MQHHADPPSGMLPDGTKPEPRDADASPPDGMRAMRETGPAADGEGQAAPARPRPPRGRPRARPPCAIQDEAPPDARARAENALVAETGEVIFNLQRQGVLKPPPADQPGGGPGHRTKNCRPVQINLSETMFRQLKMIAATQSISIKDQIIAALVRQGYKG